MENTLHAVPESPAPEVNESVLGFAEIEGLINQAQDSAQDSRTLMSPKSSERRKNGRPRKNPEDPKWTQSKEQAPPEAAPQIPAFDATPGCRSIFKVASRVLVSKTGLEECALHSQEIEELATTWGMVANQYMPAFLAEFGPLIAACGVTAGVAIRLNSTIQAEIDRRRAEQATNVKSTTAPIVESVVV